MTTDETQNGPRNLDFLREGAVARVGSRRADGRHRFNHTRTRARRGGPWLIDQGDAGSREFWKST